MNLKNAIFLIPALFIFAFASCSKKADWEGMPAPDIPLQTSENLPPPFVYKGYTVTPLAGYAATGIVLSAKRYRLGWGASISPVDIALGWKHLSIADIINQMKFEQKVRWIVWRPKGEDFPVQKRSIELSTSNNHCIPASKDIKKKLLKLRKFDLAKIEGYLVEVKSSNFMWRSSLTREDTGAHSCELIWVTGITRAKP